MALVLVSFCSLIAIPLLNYASAVLKQGTITQMRTTRTEAAKGALRTALASPRALYVSCASAGLTTSVQLAGPSLDTPVDTKCFRMASFGGIDPALEWYGIASVQWGSVTPAGTLGKRYDVNATPGATFERWPLDSTAAKAGDRIWNPALPVRNDNPRSSGGFDMPVTFPQCLVYFPGTYTDPVTITGSKPVYFASGVYYFTRPITITDSARVVVGGGSQTGCVRNDQEAAFSAINAPRTNGISGLGATWVLGADARISIVSAASSAVAGEMSVLFNKRYVSTSAVENAVRTSAGVSIVSVNGSAANFVATGVMDPFVRTDSLRVEKSYAMNGTTVMALESTGYQPITAVSPTNPADAAGVPLISVSITGTRRATVSIPDYLSVPMGLVRINTAAGSVSTASVSMSGGVAAGSFDISASRPSTFQLGLSNPVVQHQFRVVSTTTNGAPVVTSTAILQVNESGAFAVNNWEID